MEIREAISPTALKKREVEIVILESGPGSKGRKCWYGDEAIESGKDVFRGAQVYANHPSKTQMTDLPERDVREIVGRIKETYVTNDNGKKQLRGILKVLEGEQYDWVLSLVHESLQAKKEGFPPVAQVSIHADGDTEKRLIEGQEYNYVRNIKSAVSVDVVTRGGIKNSGFTKFIESYYGGKNMPMIDHNRERLMAIQRKLDEALNSEDKRFLESLESAEENTDSTELLETEDGEQFEQVYAMEDGSFQTADGEQVDPAEIFAADQEGNIYDPDDIAEYGMEMAAAEDAGTEESEDADYSDEEEEVDEGAEEEYEEDEREPEYHASSANEVPISELATRFPHVADEIDREENGVQESDRDVDIVNLKFENKIMKSRLIAEKKILESGLPEGFICVEDLLGKPPADMDRVIIQRTKMLESMVNLVESARPVVHSASNLRESGEASERGIGKKILRASVMPTY